jgi:hypothetical protein
MGSYPQQILFLCQRTLQAVQRGFAADAVTLPTRQLVMGGTQIVVDPDNPDAPEPGLLAVALVNIGQGKPGNPQSSEQIPPLVWRYATLQIELWRPASGLEMQAQLPTDEEITADAVTFLTDASVLLGALETDRANSTFTTPGIVSPHTPFAINFIRPAPITGGTGGTVAQITVALTGDP